MSARTYILTEDYEITRITGGDIAELHEAVLQFGTDEECSWEVEGDTIVLRRPMGSQMVPRVGD